MRILSLLLLLLLPATALAKDNRAALLLYQSTGETFQTAEEFEDQLDYIQGTGSIAPLKDILQRWKDQTSQKPMTASIILRGNSRPFLEKALPALEKHKAPFTLFVSPPSTEKGTPELLGWNDIRRLDDTGLVTIGMELKYDRPYQGIEGFKKDINTSRAYMREKLGFIPRLIFLPEYSDEQLKVIHDQGFIPFTSSLEIASNPFSEFYHSPIKALYMRQGMGNEFALDLILNGKWNAN